MVVDDGIWYCLIVKSTSTYILLVGFGLILLLLLSSSVIGLKHMTDINGRMDEIVKNSMVKTELLQKMRNFARERSISLHRIIILNDPFELDEEFIYFATQAGHWIQTRDMFMTMSMDEKTRVMMDATLKDSGKVVVEQRKVIALVESGQRNEAAEIMLNKVMPGQNKILKRYDEVLAHQEQLSKKEVSLSEAAYREALLSLILITVLLMTLGIAVAFFTIRQNIKTEKRRLKDKREIEYFAYHDTLTGLPNRRLLMDRLNQEVGHSKRQKNCGAVLFIDIDHFKTLNDSLGHKFGDRLIQKVAARLSNSRRGDDTVSRLGGDEFVVVLPSISKDVDEVIRQAEEVGNELLKTLSKGYVLDGIEYHVTVSIGIAVMENGLQNPDDLLMQSDSALYAAKDAGRNAVRFYKKSMQEKADKRLSIEQDIRNALFRGQFFLNYQPQINNDGEIVGIESLVRWNHPRHGIISPIEFITIAEESGLIIPMGIEILDNACLFLKSLEQRKLPESFVSLSVNIVQNSFRRQILLILSGKKL